MTQQNKIEGKTANTRDNFFFFLCQQIVWYFWNNELWNNKLHAYSLSLQTVMVEGE